MTVGFYFKTRNRAKILPFYPSNTKSMCNLFCIGLFLTGIEICLYSVYVIIVVITHRNIPIIIGSILIIICLVVEFLGIHDVRLNYISFSVEFRCIKFGVSIFLIIYIFEGNVPRYKSCGRNTMQVYCSIF